jgi:hypothetical protein
MKDKQNKSSEIIEILKDFQKGMRKTTLNRESKDNQNSTHQRKAKELEQCSNLREVIGRP